MRTHVGPVGYDVEGETGIDVEVNMLVFEPPAGNVLLRLGHEEAERVLHLVDVILDVLDLCQDGVVGALHL